MKTNDKARYQGYKFFFKEGFCWTDVSKENIKCRKKGKTIFDVLSMCLFSKVSRLPSEFFISIINSTLISEYVNNFINASVHFQINDARMLPIVIPTDEELNHICNFFKEVFLLKTKKMSYSTIFYDKQNDEIINKLYKITEQHH